MSPAASSFEVAYYRVPIILDVPAIGSLEVSEKEYARLFKQLSSSDQAQVDGAIASLRAIKAAKDAEVEAAPCSVASGTNANLLPYATRRVAGLKKGAPRWHSF